MSELVSVVLPTHNRASLLPRAIRSVLQQTYRNLELIVVDDASTDATPEAVQPFAGDPRFRYIRLDRNVRAAAARNVGIKAARGPLIAFQDDDDFWLIEKLARQVAALQAEGEGTGLNLCGHIRLDAHQPTYVGGPKYFKAVDFTRGVPLMALIATPGWLARRSYLEQVGLFDEAMKTWDDWELALRLSQVCRIGHLDEPLFIQDRVTGGGMVRNHAVFADDMQRLMAKHGHLWKHDRRIRAEHCFIIGRNEAMYRSVSEGRRWLLRAVLANPLHAKAWGALALTLLGRGSLQAATRGVRGMRDAMKT